MRTKAMSGFVTVNSAEAYIACCLAGLGLIQIPAYDVKAHLAAGELIEVMPDHRAESMPMTLLYPHRQHLSRRLQVFADWLAEFLNTARNIGMTRYDKRIRALTIGLFALTDSQESRSIRIRPRRSEIAAGVAVVRAIIAVRIGSDSEGRVSAGA
ncbi:LysR substrate-binding domain-containing protein [Sphingobium aquiterrae]|uniref:LysR substrate-binding domain-containing protein n=1 Tax=Sphingobium aquiterrae TaxID=2038656 RepID=UPI00301AA7EC